MAEFHAGWGVSQEKVQEAIRRLVSTVDPMAVIVFGSRARGEHRPDSDLDLAVILDVPESEAFRKVPTDLFQGLRMPIDLLPVAKERYERYRPWINTVHYNIDREGKRLYERGAAPASPVAIQEIC